MFPMLRHDSLARVALCPWQDLHTGDIAVFKGEEGFICHRFFGKVRSNGSAFLKTKPDITYNFDPLINIDRFIGKVVSFKRGIFTMQVNNVVSRIIGLSLGCFLPLPALAYFHFKSLMNRCFIK